MMNDRELLELAAKAAGIEVSWRAMIMPSPGDDRTEWLGQRIDGGWKEWNPLASDADALRLAVKLEMFLDLTIAMQPEDTCPNVAANDTDEDCESDPYAATRRAIVRAAAEIGR